VSTQSELTIVINGKNQASPALKQVQQDMRGTQLASKDAAVAGDALVSVFDRLKQEYRLGRITATEYRGAVKAVRDDLRDLARQTQLSGADTAHFAGAMRQMDGALRTVDTGQRQMASGMTRAAFGVQALTVGMQGGRLSAQGLSSALLTLSMGNPALMAAVAGLSAIAAVMAAMKANADTATDAMNRFADVTNRVRLEGRLATVQEALRTTPATREDVTFGRGGMVISRRQVPSERRAALEAEERALLDRMHGLSLPRPPATRGGGSGRRDLDLAFLREQEDFARRLGRGAIDPLAMEDRRRRGELEAFRESTGAGILGDVQRAAEGLDLGGQIRQLNEMAQAMQEAAERARLFGDAMGMGFGAAIDAVAGGDNVLRAFTTGVLRELAREARVKAVFEAAQGFAALFTKPAAAGAHFKAAALYGVAAGAAGIAANAAGGGRASAGGRGFDVPGGVGGRAPVHTTIIQIMADDGRTVARQIAIQHARDAALGSTVPGANVVARVPVQGLVVYGGPVAGR